MTSGEAVVDELDVQEQDNYKGLSAPGREKGGRHSFEQSGPREA